ncbi:MAG TPA: Ni,Fe-hydrogenase III large subunit, partial [Rhodoferax sp.]|nr:Ni,Fe-hydrogenase III large subunit [Rhodoferax sp.]
MKIPGLDLEFDALPAPVPVWHAQASFAQWQGAATAVRDEGGRLLAVWAGSMAQQPPCMCAAYVTLEGAFWLSLPLVQQEGRWVYPDLAA